jgi:hypothetical protein
MRYYLSWLKCLFNPKSDENDIPRSRFRYILYMHSFNNDVKGLKQRFHDLSGPTVQPGGDQVQAS